MFLLIALAFFIFLVKCWSNPFWTEDGSFASPMNPPISMPIHVFFFSLRIFFFMRNTFIPCTIFVFFSSCFCFINLGSNFFNAFNLIIRTFLKLSIRRSRISNSSMVTLGSIVEPNTSLNVIVQYKSSWFKALPNQFCITSGSIVDVAAHNACWSKSSVYTNSTV